MSGRPHGVGNPAMDGLPTNSYYNEDGVLIIPDEGDANKRNQNSAQRPKPNNGTLPASTPKFGRKGDPRMHKAVAARLADPNISLYDALVQGGFLYSRSDDGTEVDSENITLAQRKNQLSRRVRLARKNQESGGSKGGSKNGDDDSESKRKREDLDEPYRVNRPRGSIGEMQHGDAMMDHVDFPTGDEDDEEASENRRGQVAKNHPDFSPLYVLPPTSVRNSLNPGTSAGAAGGYGGTPTSARRSQELLRDEGSILQAAAAAAATAASERTSHSSSGMPLGGMGAPPPSAAYYGGYGLSGSMPGLMGHSMFSHAASMAPGIGSSHIRPSAVAIASLTSTAHAHGMTLEQLAVRLSAPSTDIAKVLSESDNDDDDKMAKKRELALRLFQVECRALYSKVMLMAGIPPPQCSESTLMHSQFSMMAWQAEGRRLKALSTLEGYGTQAMEVDTPEEEAILKVPAPDPPQGQDSSATPPPVAEHTREDPVGSPPGQNREQKRPAAIVAPPPPALTAPVAIDNTDPVMAAHDHDHATAPVAAQLLPSIVAAAPAFDHANAPKAEGHDHDHDHEHSHEHAHGTTTGESSEPSQRHMHVLNGKCGHKAVVHHPKSGEPHIDFFVNETTVECYHGIPPLGASSQSLWPSKFTCREMASSCSTTCPSKEVAEVASVKYHAQPKMIDLSEIDIDNDPEWDFDLDKFAEGGLAGIVKLASE